jgi:hypothetical protein
VPDEVSVIVDETVEVVNVVVDAVTEEVTIEVNNASSAGSVTSVAVNGTNGIETISGSPIVTSGTIVLGLTGASQSSLALADTALQSVVAGTNIAVDNTDPQNPIVSATGVGSGTVTSVAIAGTDGIEVDSGSPITTNGTITLGLSGTVLGQLTDASTALQPGDNITELVNNAGYLDAADIGVSVQGYNANTTILGNTTTGSGSIVLSNSPTLVSPALGTPSSGVATNLTGTASGLTAGTVTTNANLTGDVTSVGNATAIAAGVIVNADINAAAGILLSKTNISLTTTGTSGASTLDTATGILNIPQYSGGGGGGDVVGPASAVDDRIAIFDGATGKLIADGGQTIAGLQSNIDAKQDLIGLDANEFYARASTGSAEGKSITDQWMTNISLSDFTFGHSSSFRNLSLGTISSGQKGRIIMVDGTRLGIVVPATLSFNRTYTLPDATGTVALTSDIPTLGTNVATFLATPSSANLAAALTDETGSGAAVFGTSPTLTTPNLGTPSALTLTNATGLVATTGLTATGTKDNTTFLRGDNTWATPAGSGTVTSVAASVPTGFTVSGSPVTTTGTLAIAYDTGYQGYTTAEAGLVAGAVQDTGNETIAGVKTFSSFPVTPSSAPTTDYQVANKKYVDDNAGGGGGGILLQSVTVVDTTNRSSNSATLVASGVEATLPSNLKDTASRVRIRVQGTVGVNTANCTFFSLASWDGATETDLTPSGTNCMQSTTPSTVNETAAISYEFTHVPGATTPLTYRVTFKIENSANTVFLGRRGGDTLVDAPTIITVEELD